MQAARPPALVNASSSARSADLAAVLSDLLPTRTTARARCARISATYSRSASSCAAVLVMHTSSRPPPAGPVVAAPVVAASVSAASMSPAAIEEK